MRGSSKRERTIASVQGNTILAKRRLKPTSPAWGIRNEECGMRNPWTPFRTPHSAFRISFEQLQELASFVQILARRDCLVFLNDLASRDSARADKRAPRKTASAGVYWPHDAEGRFFIPTEKWIAEAASADQVDQNGANPMKTECCLRLWIHFRWTSRPMASGGLEEMCGIFVLTTPARRSLAGACAEEVIGRVPGSTSAPRIVRASRPPTSAASSAGGYRGLRAASRTPLGGIGPFLDFSLRPFR